MVDFLHDKLQILRRHESRWPSIRPTLVELLRNNDYPAADDYYNDAPANSVVNWKPLHPGRLQLQSSIVDTLLQKPRQPAKPEQLSAGPTIPSPPMDQCLANLSAEGIITELPGMHDPTMSLFLKPKDETTARVICDLRPLNAAYDQKPPRFHLPSVAFLLQSTRCWTRTLFTKLDVTAYFHSLLLADADLSRLIPVGFTGDPFVFNYRGRSWSRRRLPFGWSWAPCLAQRQMELLISEAMNGFTGVLWMVYYDDLLLASENPELLSAATKACVEHLLSRNLLLSMHKCTVDPASHIEWIGKELTHLEVSNTFKRTRQLAGFVAAAANCRHQRALRRLLGWLNWFCSHFPGATRALQPLYPLLYTDLSAGLSWEALWSAALAVTLGCVKVRWPTRASFDMMCCDACAAKAQRGRWECAHPLELKVFPLGFLMNCWPATVGLPLHSKPLSCTAQLLPYPSLPCVKPTCFSSQTVRPVWDGFLGSDSHQTSNRPGCLLPQQ